MNKRNVLLLVLALLGGWLLLSFPRGSHTATIAPSHVEKAGSEAPVHSPGYYFTAIPTKPVLPDPPGTNAEEEERLASLVRSIEEKGRPKREQGIVELRVFLKSSDPRVRLEAARMLYEMKDRSGYATLLEMLNSPDRVPGLGRADLRVQAVDIFVRYREHWADQAILSQYEKTKVLDFRPDALIFPLEGMIPHLHESLKQRLYANCIDNLAVLEPQNNRAFFKRIADNDQNEPEYRAAAIFGLARSGDAASLERLIAVVMNPNEALAGNQEDLFFARNHAIRYLTLFRGERMVKFFEDLVTRHAENFQVGEALAYLRYRYPKNQMSREIVKAGLQPGGASLGWDYTFLLQLARLSGDPELIALGKQTDETTSFRELEVRAGWSNAWIGEILPDWEGDW